MEADTGVVAQTNKSIDSSGNTTNKGNDNTDPSK